MGKSSYDRVNEHLQERGAHAPALELHEDLEVMVRRCDEVRSLGDGYGSVELSPYMKSLLRVTDLAARAARTAVEAPQTAAASV